MPTTIAHLRHPEIIAKVFDQIAPECQKLKRMKLTLAREASSTRYASVKARISGMFTALAYVMGERGPVPLSFVTMVYNDWVEETGLGEESKWSRF